MKNLVIERDHCAQLGLGDDGVAVGFCTNSTDSSLYVITYHGVVHGFRAGENPTALWRCPLGPELLPEGLEEEGDASAPDGGGGSGRAWLAAFSHVLELDALCIATRSGTIALLHVAEDAAQHLEQVGEIDGGVACLEWSPDGELLAILSGSGNLLVMNQAWELLYEGPALGPAAAAATAAAATEDGGVGGRLFQDARLSWRGDGKFFAVVCRDPTAAPAVAAATGSDAAAAPPPPYRVRIWDRATLELHSEGEAAEGLMPLPAWQPNGRHLYVPAAAAAAAATGAGGGAAAAAAASSGPSILLYERNGLRHGGFNLPSSAPVRALAWSCDSELLAVLTAPMSQQVAAAAQEGANVGADADAGAVSDEGAYDWVLQVWHRSNWHWYLKHERRYPHGRGGGPQIRWDEQYGGLLHVLTPGGVYEAVGLTWDTCVSERGTAVVVDGRALLLTPLRHGLVPPPMCAARVALPEAAVDVAIASLPSRTGASASSPSSSWSDEDEVVAALTSSGRLVLARSVEEDLWQETLEDQEALATEKGADAAAALLPAAPRLDVPLADGRRARALCWLYGSSSLLVLASPYPEEELEEGDGDVLVQVDVEWVSCGPADPTDPRVSPEVRLTERPPVYAGGRVLRIAPHAAGGVAVQLAGGAVARFVAGASALAPCGPAAALKVPCSVVRSTPAMAMAMTAEGAAVSREVPPLLGLSRSGMLCWGSAVISPADVTSMAIRARGPGGPALLYTTRKNLLYTVLMSQLASYSHRELTADPRSLRLNRREGDVQAAMHVAMRPDAATAASRDVAVRAVEAGAALVACPAGTPAPAPAASCPSAPSSSSAERLADVAVVLQMPRGNLEGVAPRSLVLAALVGALRRRDFGEAWRLASVQRVDLNLLVDYGWPSFLSSAGSLVAAVPRPTDLCDLLFAVRPGSVLEQGGPYAGALAWLGEAPARTAPAAAAGGAGPQQRGLGGGRAGQQQQQQLEGGADGGQDGGKGAGGGGSSGSSKVTAVCGAVREAVLALPDAAKYLEVVVTSYARSDPPQLEAAMRCIRDAKERELRATTTATTTTTASSRSSSSGSGSQEPAGAPAAPAASTVSGHSGPADKALKHLLLYVDADELYSTALGMYDMPLAYMVVVNAQKDPGEYLAELQRLAALSPPALQRHAVDMSLRRYPSALRNLVEAGQQHFQQALQLARERGLLRQLLQLYDNDPEHRPAVLDAYGEQLEASKRYEDAAVSYLAAGKLDKALRSYRAAGRWRMVFVVAGQLEYDEAAVQSLAAEVAEELAAGGQAADAAAVLLSYLGDVDNAVRTYTQAREWREAMRVAHAHGRADLVETVVAPAAAEAAAALLSESREAAERIRKYSQRLADVRTRRLALSAAVMAADEDGAAHGLPDDLQSDVVSLVSGLSIYTDATGAAGGPGPGTATASASSRAPSTVGGRKAYRQGKKVQKAGGRIRAGSPLEEASLVSHVHSLAPRPGGLEEAGQLGELLVLLGHDGDARTLQRAIAAWQAAYQEAREDMAAQPIPVDGPPHARAEMERLLQPAPDTSGVAWKWDVLRDFAA